MSLAIKSIDGVICLSGSLSANKTNELKSYFKTLIDIERRLIINLCQLTQGQEVLVKLLQEIKAHLTPDQSLRFYGTPGPEVKALYQQLNHVSNYYRAA